MKAPSLKDIPSSISNLPNLQMLDLRGSKMKYLTENFWKMLQQRHLFLSGNYDLPRDGGKKIKTVDPPNPNGPSGMSYLLIDRFLTIFLHD
ncbi:hypothetical protein LguiA_006955 [Lonicera macranthoides]